jgi:hypothetical protein
VRALTLGESRLNGSFEGGRRQADGAGVGGVLAVGVRADDAGAVVDVDVGHGQRLRREQQSGAAQEDAAKGPIASN